MNFHARLRRGTLLRRYKRFFVDVRLRDGSVVVAHCANPGSMKTCLIERAPVWLSPAANPERKLKWTLEIIETPTAKVYVNPAKANDVVADALASGRIQELARYPEIRREVRFGSNSRVDFLLTGSGRDCYVEVKNVTLDLGEGRSAFPDSVTQRGTKHLAELIQMKNSGARSMLLFCAAREDARQVEPADSIDPVYGQALREAKRAGVQLLAYRCKISTQSVELSERIPVVLPRRR